MKENAGVRSLFAIAIFSLGCFGYLLRTTAWFDAIPGDYSDARFNSVILEHLFLWLKGDAQSLWNPGFFYPAQNVLAFSDTHIGSGWPYVILRWFGLSREPAYIGWFIAGASLNYFCCFYALSKLGFRPLAASLGAFVYAFSLPALNQEAHAQLNNRYAVPLAALFLYQYLNTKDVVDAAWALFWTALQFLCSVYIGVFFVYLAIGMLIAHLVVPSIPQQGRYNARSGQSNAYRISVMILAVLTGTLAALLLWKYYQVSRYYEFAARAVQGEYMLPRPISYLLADRGELSKWVGLKFGSEIPSAYRHEHQMFIGVGAFCLLLLGIIFSCIRGQADRLARMMLVALLVLVAGTLNIGGSSLYEFIYGAPGVSSLRAVSRIILVLLFPAAVLVAVAVDSLIALVRKTSFLLSNAVTVVIWILLISVVCVESMYYQPYHYPRSAWLERQERLASLLPADLSQNAVLYLTHAKTDPWNAVSEIDAMIYSQDRKLKTLNGYSGNEPPGFIENHPCINYVSRLEAFLPFKAKGFVSAGVSADHVVLASPELCQHPAAMATTELFPHSLAANIKLSVEAAQTNEAQLAVQLRLTNTSDVAFNTVNKKAPIRLSWRFLPVERLEVTDANSGWDAREDLFVSLKPGQTQIRNVSVQTPKQAGRYVLQFSLVQEGKYWLHAFGMSVPSTIVTVQ
jgi:hypothetical protein